MSIKDKIIFARTRYSYDSYIDFWRVVRLSGFQECFVDQIDLAADKIFITTPVNGEISPHLKHRRSILTGPRKAKLVWWNIERPDAPGSPPFGNIVDSALNNFDAVWVSDRHFQTYDPRMMLVSLNSHSGLCSIDIPEEKNNAFVHMGYRAARRRDIFESLNQKGITCLDPPTGSIGWGSDRERALGAAKIMLNIHQTPAPISEPIRMIVAAAYKLPFISETLQDAYPLKPGVHFEHTSYGDLVDFVYDSVRGSGFEKIRQLGISLHKELCVDRPFEVPVLEAAQEQFGS